MRIIETSCLGRDASVWALNCHIGHLDLHELRCTRTFSLSRNWEETHPPSSFFMGITETSSFGRDASVWTLNGHIGHLDLHEVRRTRTFSVSRNCVETHPPSSFFRRITQTSNFLLDSSKWPLNAHVGHFGLLELRRTRAFSLSRNCVETHPPSSFFMRITETSRLGRDASVWAHNGHIGHLGLHDVRRTRTFSLSQTFVETHPPSSFFLRITETSPLGRDASVCALNGIIGHLDLHEVRRTRTF